jgi:hypothetical protein
MASADCDVYELLLIKAPIKGDHNRHSITEGVATDPAH